MQDFFQPNPVKNAAIYFMRAILHDWPDSICLTILKHLRDAAGPNSKLVVIDTLVTHACRSDPTTPLLDNLGIGQGAFPTALDLSVRVLVYVQSRHSVD